MGDLIGQLTTPLGFVLSPGKIEKHDHDKVRNSLNHFAFVKKLRLTQSFLSKQTAQLLIDLQESNRLPPWVWDHIPHDHAKIIAEVERDE